MEKTRLFPVRALCFDVGSMKIAFKEWALVCDALGRGDQSVIIRKGGIAEGREGFRFKHEAFFLFPTFFHEQPGLTRHPEPARLLEQEQGGIGPNGEGREVITIRYFARVEWTRWVDDWARLRALLPFHIWQDGVIRERFEYGEPNGVHVAVLRVYRIAEPWSIAQSPRYGGCRSWLQLPEPPPGLRLPDGALPDEGCGMLPVIGDEVHEQRISALRAVLGG